MVKHRDWEGNITIEEWRLTKNKNKIRRKKFVEEVRGREEEMINLEDDSNIENGKWRKNYEKFTNEGSKCAGRTIMKKGES